MLVVEAKTALKRYGFDDTDPLVTWLNAGLRELEGKHDWMWLQKVTTINQAGGMDHIEVTPADFFKVQSLRDTTHRQKLKFVTLVDFEGQVDDPTRQGVPEIYTIQGTVGVYFWPVPDIDITLRMVYQFTLDDIGADGDSMPGHQSIHYPVVMAAAYIGLQAENEEDRAIMAQKEFDSAVERLWGRFNRQELDEPQQVQDVMGYGNSW